MLAGLNTSPLYQPGFLTRVLVVLNPTETPYSGPVRFNAAFPVRIVAGRRPVLIRDISGAIVPSRLTVSDLITDVPPLPPDRILWRMELEFIVADLPARSWQAYSSIFAAAPESRSSDANFWQEQRPPTPEIRVVETDCHDGDLPLIGYFADIPNLSL